MLAYHNDVQVKNDILSQLADHASADEIVKGQYWEEGKGCAVGCTIHSNNHTEYEKLFGIPEVLARLEDTIFEGLPNEAAMKWPIKFMSAIEPGADLSLVGWKFQYWLLTDEEVNPGINHPLVKHAVKQCADVLVPLTKGQPVDQDAADAAANAARNAASAASDAVSAASAAASAASAAARSAAARSAAWGAANAAAWGAAWGAANAANSAWVAAWSAARSAKSASEYSYVLMADKLLTLLSEAQPDTTKQVVGND